MRDEQVPGFYGELAALCAKYDVVGLVGMWFSGPTETYGFLHASPQDGGDIAQVCEGVGNKLREFCDSAHRGPLKFTAEAYALKIKKGGR